MRSVITTDAFLHICTFSAIVYNGHTGLEWLPIGLQGNLQRLLEILACYMPRLTSTNSIKQCKIKHFCSDRNNEKKCSERRKQCGLAVVRQRKKFSPHCRPRSRGAGRPKFNQLHLQTQFGEDQCMQFPVIVVTDPKNKETHKQTWRLQFTAQLSAQCNYTC